jgi:hypothetical protein
MEAAAARAIGLLRLDLGHRGSGPRAAGWNRGLCGQVACRFEKAKVLGARLEEHFHFRAELEIAGAGPRQIGLALGGVGDLQCIREYLALVHGRIPQCVIQAWRRRKAARQ